MSREGATEIITGQWFESSGETRWWFDSGSVALDFANTGALPDNVEQLHAPADLGSWLHDRLNSVDPSLNERELSDALGLRAAIAALALSTVRGRARPAADVDILNLFAAMPDVPPAMPGGSRQAGASRLRAQQALSSMARDAIRILDDGTDQADTDGTDIAGTDTAGSATAGMVTAARIRQCSADDCDLVYLDTSRSGNRRWCSMQRCGNRAKVRAHRARANRP